MDIFFAPQNLYNPNERRVLLPEDELRHAVDVLRKKIGDEIICADGKGNRFHCTINAIHKHSLTADVHHIETEAPNPTKVSIAISTLRIPDRFEFFLEKATELAVTEVIPLILERSVSRPKETKKQTKHERWEKLIISAGKQSRRFYFTELHPLMTLSQALDASRSANHRLFFDEQHSGASSYPTSFIGKHTFFLIGGEGGFSKEERIQILDSGFTPLSLGKDILRAETAGIFAASWVKSELIKSFNQPDPQASRE